MKVRCQATSDMNKNRGRISKRSHILQYKKLIYIPDDNYVATTKVSVAGDLGNHQLFDVIVQVL